MRKDDPSLADLFVANTHNRAKGLVGKSRRMMEEAGEAYRAAMRQAHRFVLDDEFTELVTRAAMAPPEKTLARLQYASIPYDKTWIEFNLHVKMRTISDARGDRPVSIEGVSPRLGMLLERIDSTAFVCTLISSSIDDGAKSHCGAYLISMTEREFDTKKRYHACRPAIASEADQLTVASMWGYTNNKADDFNKMMTPEFLKRHGIIAISRAGQAWLEGLDDNTGMLNLFARELMEFTGTVRWLVTLLAMLNEVPVNAVHETPQGATPAGRFRSHKLVDYHKLTLRLPKTNPLKYIERLIGPGRRRRAHEVRTHWRTYLHETRCAPEEHAWEFDQDNGYALCGKCMAFKRRIDEHIRGDASLGWVRKDYVLKAERNLR